MNCSRCQSRMEEGHIPDLKSGGAESWWSGPPPSNLKTFSFQGAFLAYRKAFLAYKNSIPITTYRCTKCGHLELFAVRT
jgi:hypothetical protein